MRIVCSPPRDVPRKNRLRHAGLDENRENIVLLDIEIVTAPVLVPRRSPAPAIIEREHPPLPRGLGHAPEIIGRAREARQADERQARRIRRRVIEIMQTETVGGGDETAFGGTGRAQGGGLPFWGVSTATGAGINCDQEALPSPDWPGGFFWAGAGGLGGQSGG
jgi:hypothetical protein